MPTPYAIIDGTGIVINRTLWDGATAWTPPEGCTAVADPANLYPISVSPPPPPSSVTRYQARAWIFVRGVGLGLWTTAEGMDAFMVAAITSFPGLSDIEKELAKVKWRGAGAIERLDPLVAALAPILGLVDQAAIDAALQEAASIP